MKLSPQAIKEFKAIYQEEFGSSPSDQEAYEMAGNLLRLFQVIYRPIPKKGSSNHDGDHHISTGQGNKKPLF